MGTLELRGKEPRIEGEIVADEDTLAQLRDKIRCYRGECGSMPNFRCGNPVNFPRADIPLRVD
jgi:hypothetical protein